MVGRVEFITMSGFNFGAASAGGFSFGNPKSTTTTAPTGFSFGAATAAPSGGFSFGTATPTPASTTGQTSGLFSFSNPAPSLAPTSGFSFGAQVTSTPAPSSGGLAFGANTSKLNSGVGNQPAGGTTQTSQPMGGFSFGAATTQTQPSATSVGGFSFAGGVGSTSTNVFAQPAASTGITLQSAVSTAAAPTATTSQPTSTFSFGTQPQAAPALNFGLLSSSSVLSTASTPAAAQPVAPTTGLSLNFGKPADTSAAVTSTGSTTTNTPSLSSLLGTSGPSLFSSVATSTVPSVVSTVASGLSLTSTATSTGFGMKTLASSAVPTGTLATSTSLGVKAPLAGTIVQANAVGSAAATGISTATAMTYAQLENLINKWSLELEDQEKHFLQQATQVNAWDRTLMQNGERITTLHREMEKVKLDQKRLDQELDFILSQQKELEDLLTPLEESVKEQSGTIYLQHADEEREKTYKLAENIDAQLKRMAQDLKEVIEHLNTSAGPGDASNPLQQICKILNAHMDSLQWIDQNSALLQRKVEQVTKECESRRKEQERGFSIAFD
ncbi:nucleoporin 62kDa L homeolog isoform X2 [Xenopus laevis]|uniref:Nuclear pore glycoprotein p62 n=2 Tax=Xenopus laevis TaxID=8355 RepID=A0A8J1LEG1_XENLA|nr:nucleoporin 62kDa L homeolog isoform X2 [Xenopus laevis]